MHSIKQNLNHAPFQLREFVIGRRVSHRDCAGWHSHRSQRNGPSAVGDGRLPVPEPRPPRQDYKRVVGAIHLASTRTAVLWLGEHIQVARAASVREGNVDPGVPQVELPVRCIGSKDPDTYLPANRRSPQWGKKEEGRIHSVCSLRGGKYAL